MTLQVLFNNNYKHINEVALSITGSKQNGQDLINHTYLLFNDKIKTPSDNTHFIKVFMKVMHSEWKLYNSNFNRSKRPKELLIGLEYSDVGKSEPCKECLFNEIDLFKRALPLHEKALFELYYEHGLSCRLISEELTKDFNYLVTPKSVERLVNPIKTKLKNREWNLQE